MIASIFADSHSAAPSTRPRTHASAIDHDRRRQAAHREGMAHGALRIEIGLQPLEPSFSTKGCHDLGRRAVLRNRQQRQPVAEFGLQRVSDGISLMQGWHHVAHKFTITSLRLKSPSVRLLPPMSVKEISGAGCGGVCGINSPSFILARLGGVRHAREQQREQDRAEPPHARLSPCGPLMAVVKPT
jgi:hypothetical protein